MRRLLAPFRWLNDRLDDIAERAADRAIRRERCLVERGPEAARGLLRLDLARSAVYMVAAVGVSFLPNELTVRVLACAALGGMVGAQAIKLSQRASAYRSGWLDGRMRFIRQAEHHRQQGNAPADWLQTEYEHDLVNVYGGRPLVLDDEDDDEP